MSVNNNDLIAKIDDLIKQSRNIRQKYSQKGGNFNKYVDLDTPTNGNAQKGGNFSKYVDLDTPVNGQKGGTFSKYVELDTPTNGQRGGNSKYVELDTPTNGQKGGTFSKYVELDTPTNGQRGGNKTISVFDKIDFDLLLDDRAIQNADRAMSNMFGGGCGDDNEGNEDKGCGSCGSYSGGCGCGDKPMPMPNTNQIAGSHINSNSCGCGPTPTPLFPGAGPSDYIDQNNANIDAALRDIDKFLGGF